MKKACYVSTLFACDCSRTREFCVFQGCKAGSFEWIFSTEGREQDHLRRIVRASTGKPVSRWIRPERAVAEAWRLNMTGERSTIFIEKLGDYAIETPGVLSLRGPLGESQNG